MKTNIRPLHVLLCAVAAAICTGCTTEPHSAGLRVATELNDAGAELSTTRDRTDAALTSLTSLLAAPALELQPKYKVFSAAVDSLGNTPEQMEWRQGEIAAEGAAYFKHWDEESLKIKNEELKAKTVQRQAAVKKEFERVTAKYKDAQTNFAPFYSDLMDLRQTLNNDLNTAGVAAVKDVASRAQKQGRGVQKALELLAVEFKDLSMAVAPPPPAPPPTATATAGAATPATPAKAGGRRADGEASK